MGSLDPYAPIQQKVRTRLREARGVPLFRMARGRRVGPRVAKNRRCGASLERALSRWTSPSRHHPSLGRWWQWMRRQL